MWGITLTDMEHIESKEELRNFLIDWKSTKDWGWLVTPMAMQEDTDMFWDALCDHRADQGKEAA
jgi:hypothetical protein